MNLNSLEQKIDEIKNVKHTAQKLEDELGPDVQVRDPADLKVTAYELNFGNLLLKFGGNNLDAKTVSLYVRTEDGKELVEQESTQSVQKAISEGKKMVKNFCHNALDKLEG
jgi:hypothetical protein